VHIPDGFLSPPVWVTLDVVSAGGVAVVARRAQRDAAYMPGNQNQIPLLGVMGAFVFAAQMINFPVGLGTSGHLVGGALLAIVLGPSAAAVVMTAILCVQAFVFQDGGIVVLGANVFNMALAGVAAGYLPYRVWSSPGRGGRRRSASIFAAGALSVLVSACLALAELLISGVRMPQRMLAVSMGLFAVSAILEGAITVAAVGAIERIQTVRAPVGESLRAIGTVGIAAVLVAVFGILIASAAPDGIEHLASQLGLSRTAFWAHAPLAGYSVGVPGPLWLRKAAAGLTGMLVIYVVSLAAGRLLSRQRSA
jgi:cobalt/nickel transport system permease protein